MEHIRQIIVVLVVRIVRTCRSPSIAQITEPWIFLFSSFAMIIPIRKDTMPVCRIDVSVIGRCMRIVIIPLHMIMGKVQRMIFVKVIVDTNIGSLILVTAVQPTIIIPSQTILVFPIPTHLAAE